MGSSGSAAGAGSSNDGLALAMTGGGARGAYQVGVLRALAREHPDARPTILTGVSAGAINAAHLAAREGTFAEAIEDLTRLWTSITTDHVFRAAPRRLLWRLTRFGGRLLTGREAHGEPLRGLVNTAPLAHLLAGELRETQGAVPSIARNINTGRLSAVAITTTRYGTGQTVTWVQGRSIEAWERPSRVSVPTSIGVRHVMASAALPFFFPAVEVDGAWYGDGGMRLAAPLAPAVHLGAKRILAVSTRFARTRQEADRPIVTGYPPPALVAGMLFNSIFLDQLDADAQHLERVNELLAAGCASKEVEEDLRPVELLVLRPSRDLGSLARDFEPRLPASARFLVRAITSPGARSQDALSLIMFQPDYVRALIDLGQADGERHVEDLARLLLG